MQRVLQVEECVKPHHDTHDRGVVNRETMDLRQGDFSESCLV